VACVYRHIRLDKNQPFYVGIGVDIKRAYSKTHRSKHWKSIISKSEYRVDILLEDVDYSFAKEKEVEFIHLYGRSVDGGVLCNITKGGDGVLGLRHTEEAKVKMGIPNKGKKISEWHKKRISEFHKGKRHSEEHKKNMSDIMSGEKNHRWGRKASEETIKKMAAAAKRGTENRSSKLSEEAVLKIREMYKSGVRQLKIAAQFNVAKSNVSSIIKRKTWTHI